MPPSAGDEVSGALACPPTRSSNLASTGEPRTIRSAVRPEGPPVPCAPAHAPDCGMWGPQPESHSRSPCASPSHLCSLPHPQHERPVGAPRRNRIPAMPRGSPVARRGPRLPVWPCHSLLAISGQMILSTHHSQGQARHGLSALGLQRLQRLQRTTWPFLVHRRGGERRVSRPPLQLEAQTVTFKASQQLPEDIIPHVDEGSLLQCTF
ncbi:hypothetical protein NDU88_008813 [Pleurodeles waltl]|uniref:Uncharacterized protein n=1 Tax=Pleurodeles waltl TaxID=8319 RepID=A0AAV7N7J9_PLEWA|nr:hypothetical protein NDU88_008813 [Pleurodeles waltl]